MKRTELVRRIRSTGSVLVGHGSKHDWYRNPETGVYQAVPRHNEIKEQLARRIIKQLSLPND
ncbi:type II toxin-antitoxin system HicA family toxin [Candidatus Poriferisodalis multihospitum]|uniref:type II toxin-antitoxin system HicA family toxin n=1 Tax=Candidatus Poriferisodalis multihospitum TaxID=2983191 RepID=UPI003A4E3E4F